MSELRFAAVISHPIQHYSPVFRALATVPGLAVKVFYFCDHGVRDSFDPGFGQAFKWDVPLLDGYDHEFLRPGYSPASFGFREVDSPDLTHRLDAYRPHALWVHGYGQGISWRAVRWANRNGAAALYFGDSELVHVRSPLARTLKRLVLPAFFRRCDAFITIGDNNERYYRHYGVAPDRLFRGACPVDIGRFAAVRDQMSGDECGDVRRRFGLPAEAFVVALSGKLEPWKRPLDLAEAIARLSDSPRPIAALFVGDGPLRGELEARIRQLGIAPRARITGFVNQSEIAQVLLAADALAVTSDRDAHPLSVTESLALGHPIIAADRVGCVGPTDTARPGVNALVYPCGDVGALAQAIGALAGDPGLYRRMAAASLRLAPSQDVKATVASVLLALRHLRQGRFAARWAEIPIRLLDGALPPAGGG
ncbi:MAG: glycosyltransferase family 4 protein [Chromatiaceae bacterium]|nr:glycosyltransferase family 4 protein [Chromatiaceae bacterium]